MSVFVSSSFHYSICLPVCLLRGDTCKACDRAVLDICLFVFPSIMCVVSILLSFSLSVCLLRGDACKACGIGWPEYICLFVFPNVSLVFIIFVSILLSFILSVCLLRGDACKACGRAGVTDVIDWLPDNHTVAPLKICLLPYPHQTNYIDHHKMAGGGAANYTHVCVGHTR